MLLNKSKIGRAKIQRITTGLIARTGACEISTLIHASEKPNIVLPASPMNARTLRVRFEGQLKTRKPKTDPHSAAINGR